MKKSEKHYLRSGLTKATAAFGLSALLCVPVCSYAADAQAKAVPAQAVQQGHTVKGKIVDENGEPMIGVTVRVNGGKAATVTDLDGNFSLNARPGDMLEISYVGYKTANVRAKSSAMNIQMEADVTGLDDVVVIGYGTVKKRDLTGAVTTMKNEDITIAPTGNVMEALQGKVAGMDITKSSGQIGAGVNILLRGSRSIYGDNSPLFIIDGLPGSMDDVNPNDIESVDVLKDASSTAIYGSAGANGVVIITTKRGQTGKVNINFDAYYGFSGSPEYKHGMTGQEWTDYFSEAYAYKNGQYPANISALLGGNQAYIDAYNNGQWIDWADEAMGGTATTQKYSLSVTGGTEKTKIYASVMYNRDQGLLENEVRDKYSMRLNLDQQLFKWAKMGVTSSINYSKHNRGENHTFTKSLTSFPLGQAYNEDGEINYEYIDNQYTPLGDYIENQYVNNTKMTYINATGYLELTPVKGLTLRTQLNTGISHQRRGLYWGAEANALRPTYAGTPAAQWNDIDNYNLNWENIISYNLTVARDHDFGITGVSSWQHNTTESLTADAGGQDLDVWTFWRMMSGTEFRNESGYSQTKKMSYAVRFNYSYKGRYLFTFSNRWDGVSFFSKGNKWDSFPAGAIAWRISDEPFMKSTRSWLDNLKLRVGAGITGNSGITKNLGVSGTSAGNDEHGGVGMLGAVGAYATQTQVYKYPSAGISLNGQAVPFVQYLSPYGNASLGWEKSYNWNFGIDFSVLGGRIDGSLDYFTTVTRGLLFNRTMPVTSAATGWGSPLNSWENIAKTSNQGFEFTINSRNIVTKDFRWNTTLTGTWGREKIESLPSGDIIAENLFVGQPIKAIYDYKYAGIWGTNTPQSVLDAYGVKPGWVMIETNDKDGDGGVHPYSEDDRKILGHQNPNWILGLNNTFTYKGFDLTVYVMGRFGQTIYSDLMGQYTAKSDITQNQISGIDYWTEDNQGAYFPRPGTGDEQTTGITALRIYDGSFIKIKNITLGYTLPKSITRHALIEKCRFYFTAYNPWIFAMDSMLDGTDPEMGGSDVFPTYKQYVFGVNLTF